jgi:chemotaxis methyl-accepting protein methylase
MTADTLFPVVGIGCSAGGLEALEELLAHVPETSGMAFIIVQHLDPGHTSALPELLQRVTSMTVVETVDGVVVRPDHVYVIRPNYDLSILHGKLHLLEQMTPRGLRLPIDFFLRTLAEDLKERAIGVILSGMGSDGVFGLRSIKDRGGLTLVQEPSTAQSDSMPRSAIQAGVADVIAPAKAIPARIMEFLRHPLRGANKDSKPPLSLLNTLDKIVVLLRDRCRTDFSLYKPNTLQRRIERRMVVHQIVNPEDYVRLLRANPHELDLLFKELLIGVTNFFRDPEAWDCLRNEGIPSLLAERPSGGSLRAWVTACSTGEEAYSLAMTFIEAIEQIKPSHRFSLQIYATDLDPDAIERARKGVFPANIAADVSSSRLTRFFTAEDGGYRISRQVREMVVFATHDIISDPPFTKLDILCCRNLLIYFGAELQKRLLQTFHYSLNSGGLLLLGNAETIGNHDHLFKQLNSKLRLFRRLEESRSPGVLNFPTYVAPSNTLINEPLMDSGTDDIGQLTDQLIQQTFAPAAVLVSSSGDIIYISGRTGKYLEPPAGKTNINIHAMARDGLREALTGVILRALKDPQPIVLKGLKVGTNGGAQTVDVTVQAIQKPVQLRGRVIIVFQDVPTAPVRRRQGKAIEAKADDAVHQELQQTREALQLTQEEMQTTVEELKSSNEELQSTNEELQSTNEELTTSKEELQSLNEELQTVNAELQSKVEDLTWIRNDMTNLLNSTEIATIFLDNDMLLRRFSSHATKIFKLISGDVGRPLSHIVTDLDYPGLRDDAMEVLRTLMFCEKEIETHDGRWYRARIMPYRTQDNVINGVVITFIDISETKKLEASLRERGGP